MTLRVLTSFHYFRHTDMADLVDQLSTAYGGPVELFADSGAFSAATLGTTISLAEYTAWLRDWNPLIATAATLDVIGDPQATARNTDTLHSAGLPVLPAFHIGTPFPVLEQLCTEYRYLALGGMVPHSKDSTAVMRWLVRCFQIAAASGTVFHGFGQTRLATIAALPFYSVDSSSWSSGARYGAITLWDERRCKLVSVQVGDRAAAHQHSALLRSHGVDPVLASRKGFASLKHRTPEQYDVESRMVRAGPAVAFDRLGSWLAHRHSVPAPAGHHGEGTKLFLAETVRSHLHTAAFALANEHRKVALT